MTLSEKIAYCSQYQIPALNLQGMDLTGEETELKQLDSFCPHLIVLNLSNNRLKSLDFLQGLEQLEELNLKNNQEITGYNHIVEVDVWSQTLKPDQYYFLQYLPALKKLDISQNLISSFTFLDVLPHLESLSIRSNSMKSLEYLQNYQNLIHLDVKYNLINSEQLQYLQNCKSLTYLDISHNELVGTTSLQYLTELTCLNLHHNSITNIESLEALQKLEQLNISQNKRKDITPLLKLPALRYLSISGYFVEDFSPLFQLSQLILLDIQQTCLTRAKDYSFLVTFDKLKFLVVGFCRDCEEIPYEIRKKIYKQGGEILAYICHENYYERQYEKGGEKDIAHIPIMSYLPHLARYMFDKGKLNSRNAP